MALIIALAWVVVQLIAALYILLIAALNLINNIESAMQSIVEGSLMASYMIYATATLYIIFMATYSPLPLPGSLRSDILFIVIAASMIRGTYNGLASGRIRLIEHHIYRAFFVSTDPPRELVYLVTTAFRVTEAVPFITTFSTTLISVVVAIINTFFDRRSYFRQKVNILALAGIFFIPFIAFPYLLEWRNQCV